MMSGPWVVLMSFREPPLPPTAPTNRGAPFPEPSNYLLKFLVIGLPRFPNRPLWREALVSRTFLYTFLSVPGKWAPPPCCPTGSLWRGASSPEPMVPSSISFRVHNEEPSHEKRGKHLVTIHGAPRGRKAYTPWGATWFPKGIVYGTAISAPVPCSPQHDTFHLGLGGPELR